MKESLEILTGSNKETKKLGEVLAREILKPAVSRKPYVVRHAALVISLEGELGSGKTTFAQGFAKGLGVRENPRSPTFVIMQIYKLNKLKRSSEIVEFENFIHADAYRLKSKDFKFLNCGDFIKNRSNIILVEWGNKIKSILLKNSLRIVFKHVGRSRERLIKIIS